MSLKFTVVDAFTNKPFGGNPAAVIVLPVDHTFPDSTLQNIALEMNLSETAFLTPNPSSGAPDYLSFGLRWFTPVNEAVICGHATLASAFVLFNDEALVPSTIHELRFSTLSGVHRVRRLPKGIEIEFPSADIVSVQEENITKLSDTVAQAIKTEASIIKFIGISPAAPYQPYALIEIDEAVDLKSLEVNSGILGAVCPITVLSNQRRDSEGKPLPSYNIRVFAAPDGITEDPVTGSAHSFAAAYWTKKLNLPSGSNIDAKQVSARGGDIGVCWNEKRGVVTLRGEARVASRGEIYV